MADLKRQTSSILNLLILIGFVINVSTDQHVKNNVNDKDGAIDHDNRTRYDHINSNETDAYDYDAIEPSPRPDLWCPINYDFFDIQGSWFHVCQPSFCVEVQYQENYTEQFETASVQLVRNHNSTMAQFCVLKLTQAFSKCSKLYVEKSNYEILANGSLWNKPRDHILPLGDFFIYGNNTAAVCDPTSPSQTNAPSPPWCLPLSFAENEFRMDPNETVHISKLALNVSRDYYSLSPDRSNVNVCIPLDPRFQTCAQVMFVPIDEYERNENFDLVNKFYDHSYKFRHYFVADDQTQFVACIDVVPRSRRETQYLYATASAISAFCLLLALMAHTMFPTLNYHTKGLLCLAFSFMVMYICMSVRYFSGDFDTSTAYLIIFSFQYVFGLSAFFWLSALAFDLWRVFSNMSGTITPGQNQKKKRAFIAKCLYSWGIPIIMCAITIAIQYSISAQRNLKIILQLEENGWFLETRATFMFLYGPILILLIVNLIFFILTIINIRRSSSGTDMVNKKINKKLLRVYVKIFLVMGLTWFAEIISWFAYQHVDEAYWYVPDLINCLQGVLLFIIYVCKKKTLKVIKSRLGYGSSSQATQSTSSEEKSRKTSMVSLQTVHVNPSVRQ